MYEQTSSTATTSLNSSNPVVFNSDTINRILGLTTGVGDGTVRFDTAVPDTNGNVTVPSGAEVVLVSSSDVFKTTIKPPANAPVVIFQGAGGVISTFNDGPVTVPSGKTDRVVIGSSGSDSIVVADARNTKVALGTGNDTILITGAGSDTVQAGLGNSTIVGGSGHSVVELKGNAADYTVTVNNGHAVVTHAGDALVTDISKIQYVQLDNGKALVFANDAQQAGVSTLYEAAFGRNADSSGLGYWFDAAKSGQNLTQIAQGFLDSPEYKSLATQTDQDFVNNLYVHTFGRTAEPAGLAYWVDALNHGISRAQLLASFVNIAGLNLDGTIHTEATVVGTVTIVHNIV